MHESAHLEFAHLAGFFAAHGVWSVAGGETLIPLLGYQHADGNRGMDRFVLDDLGQAAEAGQQALRENQRGAIRAVLVADAYLHLDSGQTDALIVQAVEYDQPGQTMTMAVPYRPQQSPEGFAVHRPKLLEVTGVEQEEVPALAEAFFAGISSHEEAAAVWHAHLDSSK